MTEITDEQKREVRAFIDNMSTVFTDTISKIYETMELTPKIKANKPPRYGYDDDQYQSIVMDAKRDEVDAGEL